MNWYCFECMGMCVRIGKWKWVMPRRRRRCKQHGNALHVWPSRSHQSNWKPYFFPIFLLRFKLAVCLRHVRKVSGHVLWKYFLTSRYVVLKTFRRKTHQLLLFLFWGVSRRRSWLRCRRPRICCWFLRCVFLLVLLALALALLAFTWRKANWDSFNGQLRDCEAATALRNFPFPPREYANYDK